MQLRHPTYGPKTAAHEVCPHPRGSSPCDLDPMQPSAPRRVVALLLRCSAWEPRATRTSSAIAVTRTGLRGESGEPRTAGDPLGRGRDQVVPGQCRNQPQRSRGPRRPTSAGTAALTMRPARARAISSTPWSAVNLKDQNQAHGLPWSDSSVSSSRPPRMTTGPHRSMLVARTGGALLAGNGRFWRCRSKSEESRPCPCFHRRSPLPFRDYVYHAPVARAVLAARGSCRSLRRMSPSSPLVGR